jgi:adenine-specific DNA-methyltransferase
MGRRIVLDSTEPLPGPDERSGIVRDVAELHQHCGVYTNPSFAAAILDEIGWIATRDLSDKRMLEPAAGDGVFLIEAARRLLASVARKGKVNVDVLSPCIRAFELHAGEGERARRKIVELLADWNLNLNDAARVAEQWLVVGDFLLDDLEPGTFSHVGGNPPYARWSKIPSGLRSTYEAALPKEIAKGDIFLPFLARGIEALEPGGRLGFLCSNRWEYMAFAADFRSERLPLVKIVRNEEVRAGQAYQRVVDIYPSILVLEKLSRRRSVPSKMKGRSLTDLGFEIKVGPALGCTPAYVLGPSEAEQVESELLAPWLNSSDVGDGMIAEPELQVICLYDADGRLRDLDDHPRAKRWLSKFRERLEARSIVRKQGAIWYRPIDRVFAAAWAAPKLLIPELSKVPRIAVDRSGAIPSHGIYSIVAKDPTADLKDLHDRLAAGRLERLLEGKAPKVKGEYWRCYKSILKELRL